jgi:uncharacterized ferritin-like protein (DUF455 family)
MSLDRELFGQGPARDARFDVRDVWAELTNFSPEHPELTREFLHRQMNEEVEGLEMSARNLADFPDAPWDLRMAIARQCWDEARHVNAFRRALESRGGAVGDYPVINFQYRILTRIDSLIGRLAVQNRGFEAAGLDAIDTEMERSHGDADLSHLFDLQLADEVQHVRYANVWMKRLVELHGPRAIVLVARAMAQATEALRVIAGDAIVTYPVVEELRREAGFTDAEIEAARQQATAR